MAPGKKDHRYKGRREGVKYFEQKRYLLWPLRDLHDALNGKHEANDDNSYMAEFQKVYTGCNEIIISLPIYH